jgi:hypothetical protein
MPITAAPIRKFPVLMAYICIANVNPQGKKKVSSPVRNAEPFGVNFCWVLWMSLLRNLGNPIEKLLSLGKILIRFNHRSNIINHTIIVRIAMVLADNLMIDPKSPSNPPSAANHKILPALK